MKKILIPFVALVAFAITAQAQFAQRYVEQTLATGLTTIGASTTSNCASGTVIDCRKQQNVAVSARFCLTGAGTSATTFTFLKSVDGVNFDTDPNSKITWAPVGTGATTVVATTNLAVAGVGYLKLTSIQNGNNSVLTNEFVKYAIKMGSP
jgi:hypothetical protein